MKIDSAAFSMQASHESLSYRENSETLRSWRGNRRPDFESATVVSANSVSISQSARFALAAEIRNLGTPPPRPAPVVGETNNNELAAAIDAANAAVDNDPFLSMIRSMVEMLTGRAVKTFTAADLSARGSQGSLPAAASSGRRDNASSPPARAGFGVEYERHEVYEEFESANFSAHGVIRTEDGQEIQFSLDLQMERRYREESHVRLRYGDAVRKDPLVVNFAGSAAQLLDQHFRFDLDSDGQAEELPMLGSGSGYLAFDRNGNGRIDSGSELFGPASDNGFTELALLDADRNGWIDEADPLFSQLGIWRPSAEGASADTEFQSLAASSVGALGLANLATPFELRGAGNSNLGGVRSTGIALTEDGKALSVQEIDLSVG